MYTTLWLRSLFSVSQCTARWQIRLCLLIQALNHPRKSMGHDCCADDGRFGVILGSGVEPESHQNFHRVTGGEVSALTTFEVAGFRVHDKKQSVHFKRKKHPEEPVPLPIPEPSTVEVLVLSVAAVALVAGRGRRRRRT